MSDMMLTRQFDEHRSQLIGVSRAVDDIRRSLRGGDADRQKLREHSQNFVRNCALRFLARKGETLSDVAMTRYPHLTKAVSGPATTVVPGWAAELIPQSDVVGFLLGGKSSNLLARLSTLALTVSSSGRVLYDANDAPLGA